MVEAGRGLRLNAETLDELGIGGQASDIAISAKQILKTKDRLNQLLAKNTGQPLAKVEKETDRDFWLSAEEAKLYGVVDEIIKNSKEVMGK